MADAAAGARPAPALAVLALVFNALVWGLSWWPFRRLAADGVHPLWSTAMVYAASLVVFLAWQPRALKPFAHQPLLWALAAASGLTNVGFNWAVTVGDVVRVVLLFYLMPAWSVLLAWLILGEQPSAGGLARVALALFGVFTVLDTSASGFPWPRTLPDVLALMGGFSFALTNVLLRRLAFEPAGSRSLAMFGGGTLLGAGVAVLGGVQGVVPALPPLQAGWAPVAGGLALAFLASNLALQYGAARLKAHTTALVMLSEVVFASLSSVALGAASLAPRTLVGGGLIVLAAAWSAWPRRARAAGAQ
jgi:drug/metabolite transporter (DMT)-like permease